MTTAVIATPPFLQFEDSNGLPLAGGLIYTYAAGTTTPKATYTDQGAGTPMPNPIVLDSAGRATWWITGAYKYIVKDALGNTIATTDNVTSFNTLAAAGSAYFQSFSGDGTTTAFTLSTDEGTDSKGLMIFLNAALPSNIANGTFATDTIWSKGAGWTIGAGVATATGAISTAISQTSLLTLVAGQAYSVTYTITRSAGSIVCNIGGYDGTARSSAGTYQEVIVTPAGSQLISFTGAGFTGTLDNVTVNPVSSSGFQIQNPNSYTIAGTALTFASAPPTGTNNIFVFAPSSLLGAASSAAALAQGYAAAALTSQTAAAVSASSAAGYAAAKNQWTYSTTTSMADPGTGFLRFNNATLASATAMAISNLSSNSGNPDLGSWVSTWDDSGSATRGALQIFKDNGNFVIFAINGVNVDNTGWKQISLTNVSSVGSFSNSDTLLIGFTAYGSVSGGTTGSGATVLQNSPTFTGTPATPLLAIGSPSSQFGALAVQANGATTFAVGINNSDATTAGQVSIAFSRNASVVGSVQTTNTTTSYVTTSDKRLKTDVKPLDGSVINSIQPVTYKWVDVDSSGVGFLAQDLALTIPEAVTVGDMDITLTDRNAEGFRVWGVDLSKIVPYLVAKSQNDTILIQQLSERIEALEK